jgi:hypothetical protein
LSLLYWVVLGLLNSAPSLGGSTVSTKVSATKVVLILSSLKFQYTAQLLKKNDFKYYDIKKWTKVSSYNI